MRGARATRLAFGALAVASLLGLGGFLLWSDTPRARYAGLACHYRAVYERPGPLAAVVLGTSRAQRGIDPVALADGLGLDPGVDPVANLARGGRGPGQLRQLLEDLDRERGIAGPILFANIYAMTRDYGIAFAALVLPSAISLYCLIASGRSRN